MAMVHAKTQAEAGLGGPCPLLGMALSVREHGSVPTPDECAARGLHLCAADLAPFGGWDAAWERAARLARSGVGSEAWAAWLDAAERTIAGQSMIEIAAALGTTRQNVHLRLRKAARAGLYTLPEALDVSEAARLHGDGLDVNGIAVRLRTAPKGVKAALKRAGLMRTPPAPVTPNRSQETSDRHFARVSALGWPMTPNDMARAHFGREPTTADRVFASRWFGRWVKEGRIVRVFHGVYALAGSEAAENWRAHVQPAPGRAGSVDWDARWERACALGWPLQTGTLLRAVYGDNPTDGEATQVSAWLRRWCAQGKIVRVAAGLYALAGD